MCCDSNTVAPVMERYRTQFCLEANEHYHSYTASYLTPFILTPYVVQELKFGVTEFSVKCQRATVELLAADKHAE